MGRQGTLKVSGPDLTVRRHEVRSTKARARTKEILTSKESKDMAPGEQGVPESIGPKYPDLFIHCETMSKELVPGIKLWTIYLGRRSKGRPDRIHETFLFE